MTARSENYGIYPSLPKWIIPTTQTVSHTSGLERNASTVNDGNERNKSVKIFMKEPVFADRFKLTALKSGKNKEHKSVLGPDLTASTIGKHDQNCQLKSIQGWYCRLTL
jgi:hypothetical protein